MGRADSVTPGSDTMHFRPARRCNLILLALAIGRCTAESGSQPPVRTAKPNGLFSEGAAAAACSMPRCKPPLPSYSCHPKAAVPGQGSR